MSRADPQVNFRMPQELKDKLEAAAALNRRSTTAELIARLESTFASLDHIRPGKTLTGQAARNVRVLDATSNQQTSVLPETIRELEQTYAAIIRERVMAAIDEAIGGALSESPPEAASVKDAKANKSFTRFIKPEEETCIPDDHVSEPRQNLRIKRTRKTPTE